MVCHPLYIESNSVYLDANSIKRSLLRGREKVFIKEMIHNSASQVKDEHKLSVFQWKS